MTNDGEGEKCGEGEVCLSFFGFLLYIRFMKLHRQLNVWLVTIILLFTSCNQDEEDNAGSGNNQPTSEHSCGAPNFYPRYLVIHTPPLRLGTWG